MLRLYVPCLQRCLQHIAGRDRASGLRAAAQGLAGLLRRRRLHLRACLLRGESQGRRWHQGAVWGKPVQCPAGSLCLHAPPCQHAPSAAPTSAPPPSLSPSACSAGVWPVVVCPAAAALSGFWASARAAASRDSCRQRAGRWQLHASVRRRRRRRPGARQQLQAGLDASRGWAGKQPCCGTPHLRLRLGDLGLGEAGRLHPWRCAGVPLGSKTCG